MAEINDLASLEENWNTYGAKRISPDSILHAGMLASALSRIDTVDKPLVTGTPDGNVAFAWDDGVRSLDLEIHRNGLLEYSFIHEQDDSLSCEGSTREIEKIVALLAAFR